MAAETGAGGATSGSWFTRTLNTEAADSASIGTLSSNEITLPAGTYECEVSVPAYEVDSHQARLYNVTGTAVLLYGTAERSQSAQKVQTSSRITGRFTLAGSTAIRIEHQVSATKATDGLGKAANFGNAEVYTVARFWKVG